MAKEILHVVPHNDGWAVKREGNERSSTTHQTQKEAIDSARELAREGDDIVIHRPDGTIRDRTTYSIADRANGKTIKPSDILSVGSRVSWPAIFAGAVVALVVYITLMMLAAAIGITNAEHISSRAFVIGTAVVMTFSLMVALFLGGYVASLTTTRENRAETVVYGVLVWGTLFGILFILSSTTTFGVGSILQPSLQARDGTMLSGAEAQQQWGLTDEQRHKYEQTVAQRAPLDSDTLRNLAWWTFATLVLSLLSGVGGALLGAGPELVFHWRPAASRETAPQSSA